MASERGEKRPLVEQGLLTALQALDNQIARAMERSPSEREVHGVQKWQPISDRIETVAAFMLTALGEEQVRLDSLLVISQASAKALTLIIEDLGEEGLGQLRTGYCRAALESIADSMRRAQSLLSGTSLS